MKTNHCKKQDRIYPPQIVLAPATMDLWHEFYKNYVSDPIMESGIYTYNHDSVTNSFHSKTSDPSRLYFFILIHNRVIGQIYLKHMDRTKKTTEFGIALTNDSVKGKGYGTAAIRLIIDYASSTLGFERILADTISTNTRSQHILTKLGFRLTNQDSGFSYYELSIAMRDSNI